MSKHRPNILLAAVAASLLCTPLMGIGVSRLRAVYAREACSLLKDGDSCRIVSLVRKGDALSIRTNPLAASDTCGTAMLPVRTAHGETGYVYKKYLTADKMEAARRYRAQQYDTLHMKARNTFNAGDPLGCDFYPHVKPTFNEKQMPQACYALYLNCSPSVIGKIDSYIALAKKTRINTFVLDLKEDGLPGFKADAMRRYAPSAYNRAPSAGEKMYSEAVEKIHDAGFWAVGRIVVFKDYHFTKDNPDCALWDKENNQMLLHNKSNWPSAYSRKVWEYNADLACEAVDKFGFDEINFDYVRFPDRMQSIENGVEMRNSYGETKIQAIQRFVKYAVDRIHEHRAYVSIDVFGESANPGYTTAYGQYWPAISNYADIICGMPYPDHFTNGYYGIRQPWNHPYEIMHAWGTRVMARQEATPSPAVVRTWVQAYHVMKHVDRNGIDYDAANIEKEIRGLYDAGLTGGYTTWLSSSNLERYCSQAPAFSIDYYTEYITAKPPLDPPAGE